MADGPKPTSTSPNVVPITDKSQGGGGAPKGGVMPKTPPSPPQTTGPVNDGFGDAMAEVTARRVVSDGSKINAKILKDNLQANYTSGPRSDAASIAAQEATDGDSDEATMRQMGGKIDGADAKANENILDKVKNQRRVEQSEDASSKTDRSLTQQAMHNRPIEESKEVDQTSEIAETGETKSAIESHDAFMLTTGTLTPQQILTKGAQAAVTRLQEIMEGRDDWSRDVEAPKTLTLNKLLTTQDHYFHLSDTET